MTAAASSSTAPGCTRCPTRPPSALRAASWPVTDGPFAETKEQVAGYDVIDCPDLDSAVAVAAAHPTLYVGAIEVRAFGKGMPDPELTETAGRGQVSLPDARLRRHAPRDGRGRRGAGRASRRRRRRTSTTAPTRSTPGSTTAGPRRLYGWALELPSRGGDRAPGRRRGGHDRRAVRGDQGADRGLRPARVRRPRRRAPGRGRAPGRRRRRAGAAAAPASDDDVRRTRSPSASSESWGRLVAGLIGWCGDWDLSEECAQRGIRRSRGRLGA